MFIVCVTDTQPKECKGVIKRQMDVVTVDSGEPFDRLCNEGKTRGVNGNHVCHCSDPHRESETQSNLQASHCTRTSECFTISVSVFFLATIFSGWKSLKLLKS